MMSRVALSFAFALSFASLAVAAPVDAVAASQLAQSSHAQLVRLFADWRAFNHPAIVHLSASQALARRCLMPRLVVAEPRTASQVFEV